MERILLAGLGNPGAEYEKTRHNAGFMLAELAAAESGFTGFVSWKKEALVSEGVFKGGIVYIVKPFTYMNNSGEPLKRFADMHNVKAGNILVFYDDISLELGRIRLRKNGSAGGHNGMKSIIESFGTDGIKRLRIGIGPKNERLELKNFVLSPFRGEELKNFEEGLKKGGKAVTAFLEKGMDYAMNAFNL